MPSWNQILKEIEDSKRTDALDFVRRSYLKKLFEKRQRNIICYYSGWLQKPGLGGVEIDDNDKNALMAAVHQLDRNKGLDLFLHTPGGQVAATESLVDYLRKMFNTDIVAFVPQIAMSAGTMIACSAKTIFLGKQSNLGPIDPQFSGIPAFGVIEEFKQAVDEIKADSSKIPLWQVIIGKYHPTFIGECLNAINWSQQIVTDWLKTGMFLGETDSDQRAKAVVAKLTDRANMKTHSRHLSAEACKDYGMKIEDLESDNELQDLVLTVHHCFMHTFSNSAAIKIVENHNGVATVHQVQMIQKKN
jgi:ATP-dependent protease ClpP protease subunit